MDASRGLAPVASSLAVFAVVVGTWSLVGPGQPDSPVRPQPLPSLTVLPDRPPTDLPSVSGGFLGGPPRMPVPSGRRTHVEGRPLGVSTPRSVRPPGRPAQPSAPRT